MGGTAPNTTTTPLQQRIFGTSATAAGQYQPGQKIKAERKWNSPSGGSNANKTTSPVKQSKLNVLSASSAIKQEPSNLSLSAASRKSLFSPPSDTELSPFKVMKSPANNNRSIVQRSSRRTRTTSSTSSEEHQPNQGKTHMKVEEASRFDSLLEGTAQQSTKSSAKMKVPKIEPKPTPLVAADFRQ